LVEPELGSWFGSTDSSSRKWVALLVLPLVEENGSQLVPVGSGGRLNITMRLSCERSSLKTL